MVEVLAGKTSAALLMLAVIVVVALALVRVYQQAAQAARDSSPSRGDRQADDKPGAGRRLLERLGLLRQWRAAASIRRIYRLMCRAAAAAGYPRLEAETPNEYLPTLSQVWPENAAEARLITDAFIRVRYGELPETAEEAALLAHLSAHPVHVDELGRQTGLPISMISSTLTVMELKGMVQAVGGMNYVRMREEGPTYDVGDEPADEG